MDWMRISLVLAGIVLVAAIYLWERHKQHRREAEQQWSETKTVDEMDVADRDMPATLTTADEDPLREGWSGATIKAERRLSIGEDVLAGLKGIHTTPEEENEEPLPPSASDAVAPGEVDEAPRDEAVIAFALMAREGEHFSGMQILDAMELCGLHFGKMGIFHYPETDTGQTLFSIANILEPGSFDRERMDELETPGLALFMPLPAPIDGERALLTFVQQAKRLREQLAGRLTDGQRRELTRETIDELKKTARRFRLSAK